MRRRFTSQARAAPHPIVQQGGGPSDWTERSTAPGVEQAIEFETQTELDAYYHSNRVPVLDTGIKPSGRVASMRFDRESADGEGATNVRVQLARNYSEGDVLWRSVRVRSSPEFLYQVSAASSGTNGQRKITILSAFSASFQPWEVVMQLTQASGTWRGYHQIGVDPNFVHWDLDFASDCSGSDLKWQPGVDNGSNPLSGTNPDTGSAWSACEQDRAQYGGLFSARGIPAGDYRVGIGDPISGAFRHHSEFVTFTQRVIVGTWDSTNSRITTWAAPDGDPYVLLADETNVRLGGNGPFSGDWLTLFESTKTANSGFRVGSRTNNIPVAVRAIGLGTPTGAGTLSWNASTQRLTFAASGETVGTARGVTAQKPLANVASSGADSYLGLEVTGTMPGSNHSDTITIASGLDTASVHYSEWIESTQEIRATGGHRALSTAMLETVAADMSEGQIVQLTGGTAMGGLNATLISDETLGGQVIEFGPRGHYDPTRRTLFYMGQSHASGSGRQKELTYDLASNQWSYVFGPDTGIAHLYYMVAVDQKTGTRYMLPYSDATTVRRKRVHESSWTNVTGVPQKGNFIGAAERNNALNSGAGGLVWADDGGIYVSNAVVSSWTEPLNLSLGGLLHNFAANLIGRGETYVGGGDNGSSSILRWWRVNSAGSVTEMPTLPKSMGVSGKAAVVPHPNGTHLLAFGGTTSDKSVIRFDPVTQTWSSNLGNHTFADQNAGGATGNWVWYATLHELGVVFVMQALGGGAPTAYLYRPHAVAGS